MKNHVSDVSKALIIFLLLVQLSYLKILGGTISFFENNSYSVLSLVFAIIIVMIFMNNIPTNRILWMNVAIVYIFAFLGGFLAIKENGMVFKDAFWGKCMRYFYVLLSIPLYQILIKKKLMLRELMKMLSLLCLGAYLIRTYIAVYWMATGNIIYENIALEHAAENWIRNDSLRLNPPCIALFYVAITYYLLLTSSKKRNKNFWFFAMCYGIIYSVYIHQSRGMLIYQVITVLFMYLFRNVSDRKKIFRYILLIIGITILVNTPVFSNFVNSFNATNSIYGGSTLSRMTTISYAINRLKESPVFGTGFLSSDTLVGGTNLSDVGILYSITQMGILMLLVYVWIYARGFYVSWKLKKNNYTDLSLLIFGITLNIILVGISIDCFYGLFAFSVPFYISLVEYSARVAKNPVNSDL